MPKTQKGTFKVIQGSKIAKRLPSVKYSLLQYSKIENFTKKNSKKITYSKNGPSGAPGPASASPWRATAKKRRGDTLGKKIRKKFAVPKKMKGGGPLVSPGMVCYAEKQEKPFWFSSLGQIVQFGVIIFCRTFKNYFGQFMWKKNKESL